MSSRDEVCTMLDDIEKRESQLSDWERKFVDHLADLIGKGRTLTEAQDRKLSEIWERIT